MGQGALKAGSAFKRSNASMSQGRTAPNGQRNVKSGGGNQFRSEGTIKRLQMYKSKPNIDKMMETPTAPVRIQPDRRWFGNTRVIAQGKMQAFRETLSKGVEDPYSVVLKSSLLPMSLLRDTEDKSSRMNLLSVEPFKEVFGKRRRQKRVKLGSYDLESLVESVAKKGEGYDETKDLQAKIDLSSGVEKEKASVHAQEEIFNKGTSGRIWRELYKVLDASDVVLMVLDSRDPMGTRCIMLEREIRKNHPHKKIILLLNKVDLCPTWVSKRWVQELTKEYPTLAFHASITNPFGKNALLNLLRQFANLQKESKHMTVGMVGYPNVGKSSVINTMRRKKVCKACPVPGETKVWQYIALTKKIYLLDCPGVVPPTKNDWDSDAAKVLKGVVRAERIQSPSDYINEVLARVKPQYLRQRYKLPPDTTWTDYEDFLGILGTKMGKLRPGGEPDIEICARMVLYDWQRGRIPFFVQPPKEGDGVSGAAANDGASASNAPAPQSTDETPEPESSGRQGREDGAVAVQQSLASLSEIPCALEYDEEDRQGEALPPPKTKRDGSKRKANGSAGEDAAASGPAPPKKKARRRGGGGASGTKDKMAPLKHGSVDWKAVHSEFAM
jgi:nuclear GTP-binding protein